VIGFLTHFSFIFLFDYWGVKSLSYFNIFSVILWAWAIAEVWRGYYYRSVYIGSTEILLHAVYAMSVLGFDSGFDLYLWPLAAWLAYNPNVNHKFAVIIASASIILWIFGRAFLGHSVEVLVSAETLNMMLQVNATIAGVIFIFGIVSARVLVERQRKQLKEQAHRDELTGLYNRRYVTEFINLRDKNGQPDRRSYALIMIDIDYFKSINDRYGHEVGDEVLQAFSYNLENKCRKEDMVCRWGGEEFLIILPKCTLEQAIVKAEAIRRWLADEATLNIKSVPLTITASFGVGVKEPGEFFSELVSKVDKLLYRAKESGRNTVCSY
jgi:diguanylate cyclase (GGDEF)-like protein